MSKVTASKVAEGMSVRFMDTRTSWVEEIVAKIEKRNRRLFFFNPEGQYIGWSGGWAPNSVLHTDDI